MFFADIFLEKILIWISFQKNFRQNFKVVVKKQQILQDFDKIKKKNSPKMENMGLSHPYNRCLFFPS